MEYHIKFFFQDFYKNQQKKEEEDLVNYCLEELDKLIKWYLSENIEIKIKDTFFSNKHIPLNKTFNKRNLMVTHTFTNHRLCHSYDNDFKIIKKIFLLVEKSLKKIHSFHVVSLNVDSLEISYVQVLKNVGETIQLCNEDDNG